MAAPGQLAIGDAPKTGSAGGNLENVLAKFILKKAGIATPAVNVNGGAGGAFDVEATLPEPPPN